MSNIFHNNFHNLKLRLNTDEYWDLSLDKGMYDGYMFDPNMFYDKCLTTYIDVSLPECYDLDILHGLEGYTWEHAQSIGYTLKNIGYTGFDNGLLCFRKDKIMNKDFLELYQNSEFEIEKSETLFLHPVSGMTQVYEYPMSFDDCILKLNGGFYQGFFKTECDKYQVLPTVLEQGDVWVYEFVLKREDFEKESDKTLNDKYPENKGIFFYLGTRAENKWIYLYDNEYKESIETESSSDDCFTLSYDDYIEDAHVDTKDHLINSFLDMSIEMPVEWESIAMDEYLSHKYYDKTLYNHTHPNKITDSKELNIIDEINNPFEFMEWCCMYETKEIVQASKLKCYCNCCKRVNTVNEITTTHGGYFSKCELFGDDYLVDEEFDCLTDYIEDDIDISDFIYETENEFTIGVYEEYWDTDNKFLLFDRTKDGFNVHNWIDGSYARYIKRRNTFNENLFLLMNRTPTGYTVHNIHELISQYDEKYDVLKDLYNNALAFRITDDGKIGYRYLIKDCDSDERYSIKEGYSKPNIVPYGEWSSITVKIQGLYDNMVLRFYVNGNLVFITDPMPKIQLRALDEIYEKQETVPFNISLGGGTQGLCDVILPNYMIKPYRHYPLEKHFAGTFIGYFKVFKFYTCDVEYMNIRNNFLNEIDNLQDN